MESACLICLFDYSASNTNEKFCYLKDSGFCIESSVWNPHFPEDDSAEWKPAFHDYFHKLVYDLKSANFRKCNGVTKLPRANIYFLSVKDKSTGIIFQVLLRKHDLVEFSWIYSEVLIFLRFMTLAPLDGGPVSSSLLCRQCFFSAW